MKISKNFVIKGIAVLLGFVFFSFVIEVIGYALLLQVILLLAEMAVNSFMSTASRESLQSKIARVSSLDSEKRLKFKRPLNFIFKLVASFFKYDFEAQKSEGKEA